MQAQFFFLHLPPPPPPLFLEEKQKKYEMIIWPLPLYYLVQKLLENALHSFLC